MSENSNTVLDSSIDLKTVLVWGGIILTATASGVYALTNLAVKSQVAALEKTLTLQDSQILELKQKAETTVPPTHFPKPQFALSEITLEGSSQTTELKELALHVTRLEAERSELLTELVRLSKESLEPGSELAVLLEQLSSKTEPVREEALTGLFELKDPRSLDSLISFFYTDPKVTRYHSIFDWLDLIWELDESVGIQFSSKLLESKDLHFSNASFRQLKMKLRPKKL